jgi:2'-5' RNA ligase
MIPHQSHWIFSSILVLPWITKSFSFAPVRISLSKHLLPSTMEWQALPPRTVSNRGRQRRLRTTDASDLETLVEDPSDTKVDTPHENSNNTNDTATVTVPAWKRNNTPGLNSYLKVVLDDATLDKLHDITANFKTRFEELLGQPQEKNGTGSRTRRPLRIKPRPRMSLHMTFYFGGEVLTELPAEELLAWHAALTDRLAQSNFMNACSRSNAQRRQDVPDFSISIRELAIFPPRRNNLIVAILDASPAWDELYSDVRKLSMEADSMGLREITKRSKDRWTAHITLANLQGGSKSDLKQLAAFLRESGSMAVDEGECHVKCLSMGGPMPQQVELDWDFAFFYMIQPASAKNSRGQSKG